MGRDFLVSTVCLLEGRDYRNTSYVLSAMEDALPETDLLVLPHMPFLKYPSNHLSSELEPFLVFASDKKTYIALSIIEMEIEQKRKYNSAVLIDPEGEIIGKYRKSHKVFDDDMETGDEIPVFDTGNFKIGLTIGTDFYFPEIYEVLKMKGAEIITWHTYPERGREHTVWEPLLFARCVDSRAFMVTAMYADEETYVAKLQVDLAGPAWGRSMVLNRSGVPVADTGYADGCAFARIHPDKYKKIREADREKGDPKVEDIFIVNSYGDRASFAPITRSYTDLKKPAPDYKKRTCRLAVASTYSEDEIGTERISDAAYKIFEEAAKIKPDLLLFTEQRCRVVNEATDRILLEIGETAKALNCYVAMGGITNINCSSVCHVWDRAGDLVYAQPIFWPFEDRIELKVFDTDFGRIGAHTCGDLWCPVFDRVLALKGAEIIIDPSHMRGPDGRCNETMLRARAIDSSAWVAVSHGVTIDPSLRSLVIDPSGQVVSASSFNRPGINFYDVHLDDKKFYYEGVAEGESVDGEDLCLQEIMPVKKEGWKDAIFSARRPELYGIIPTNNSVIIKHRGTYGKDRTEEKKGKKWDRPELNRKLGGF